MNDRYRATPKELEAQIELLPKVVLPQILIVVLRQCLKHDVFNGKPLHRVVETLTNNLTGWKNK